MIKDREIIGKKAASVEERILRYLALIKVTKYGSITRAARLLDCTPEGITHRICALEIERTTVLIKRVNGKARPTPAGLKALKTARRAVEEYSRSHPGEIFDERQPGKLTIAALPSVAAHWLPGIAKKFRQDYPKVDLALEPCSHRRAEELVLAGRVDGAFLQLPAAPELNATFLEEDNLMVALPPNHPRAADKRFPIAALCTEPFLLLEKDSGTDIRALFSRYGISPACHFTALKDADILSLVEKGKGICILPQLSLRDISHQCVVRELDVPAYRHIGFAAAPRTEPSPLLERFRRYLKFR